MQKYIFSNILHTQGFLVWLACDFHVILWITCPWNDGTNNKKIKMKTFLSFESLENVGLLHSNPTHLVSLIVLCLPIFSQQPNIVSKFKPLFYFLFGIVQIIWEKMFLSKLIWKKKKKKPTLNFFYIFLLDVNFKNLTVRLYVLIISSILVKFQENQRSITMSLITCLNFKLLWWKVIYKK